MKRKLTYKRGDRRYSISSTCNEDMKRFMTKFHSRTLYCLEYYIHLFSIQFVQLEE